MGVSSSFRTPALFPCVPLSSTDTQKASLMLLIKYFTMLSSWFLFHGQRTNRPLIVVLFCYAGKHSSLRIENEKETNACLVIIDIFNQSNILPH